MVAVAVPLGKVNNPKATSTPYYRSLGPFWVPEAIKKDYLDPLGKGRPVGTLARLHHYNQGLWLKRHVM